MVFFKRLMLIVFSFLYVTPQEINFQIEGIQLSNRNKRLLEDSIDLEISDKFQIIAKIYIGSTKQYSEVLMDTGSTMLWVAGEDCLKCPGIKNRFVPEQSSSFKNTTIAKSILYGTGQTKGFLSYDTILMGDLKVESLQFLLAYDSGPGMFCDGIFGLANYYEDASFSVIEQLYSQKKISKRIFAQKFTEGTNKGIFSIGNIPDEIKNNDKKISKKTYGTCKILTLSRYGQQNNFWECNLDRIYFGSDVNRGADVNFRINFDSGTNLIVIPQTIFDQNVIGDYMKKFFDKNICSSFSNTNFYQIKCNLDTDISQLPPFNFKFGDFSFYFRPEEIFVNKGTYLEFRIKSMPKKTSYILGTALFKKFTIVFDKENQEIGFYGKDVRDLKNPDDNKDDNNDTKDDVEESKSNTVLIIIIIASSVFALGIILFFLIRYKCGNKNNISDKYTHFSSDAIIN